jgi:hypothetical protein
MIINKACRSNKYNNKKGLTKLKRSKYIKKNKKLKRSNIKITTCKKHKTQSYFKNLRGGAAAAGVRSRSIKLEEDLTEKTLRIYTTGLADWGARQKNNGSQYDNLHMVNYFFALLESFLSNTLRESHYRIIYIYHYDSLFVNNQKKELNNTSRYMAIPPFKNYIFNLGNITVNNRDLELQDISQLPQGTYSKILFDYTQVVSNDPIFNNPELNIKLVYFGYWSYYEVKSR